MSGLVAGPTDNKMDAGGTPFYMAPEVLVCLPDEEEEQDDDDDDLESESDAEEEEKRQERQNCLLMDLINQRICRVSVYSHINYYMVSE
jgi:TATA-binding protein-associated factor Taf7